MKKLIYILLALVFVSIGCTEGLELDGSRVEEGIVLTIYNSPLTKATTDPGTDYERQLNTLDCFFYPKGQTGSPCVFYHRENVTGNTSGEVKFTIDVLEDAIRKIFPTENTCEIFVIANLPSEVIPEGVTFDPNPENVHTRLDSLTKYVLQMKGRQNSSNVSSYDDIEKPFVMAGRATGQKDSKKNASATISLRRAASKITFSVAIPEYLIVKDADGNSITMTPQLTDDQDNITLRAALHNGTSKGYLCKDADSKTQNSLFDTQKYRFEYANRTLPPVPSKINPQVDSIPERRVYNCEIPFYTYARAWEKGSSDAAYMTFEMPWGYDKGENQGIKYDTYYYQILINGAGRKFEPNNWYDMFVNIGVIGSTVENIPIVIDHQVFYVLDWTDEVSGYEHPDEDVQLEIYTYFIVNQKFIEVDNQDYCYINYNASHDIAWEITSAYYYDNSGVTSTQVNIDRSTITFNNTRKGVLTVQHNIPSSVYSPTYINLNIWLDLDKDGVLDNNERADYLESVSIIQYPAMYVERDLSCLRSIYVNGERASYTSGSLEGTSISGHPLGYTNGVQNFEGDNENTNYSMFIINVSSFDSGDEFSAPYLENGYFRGVNSGNYSNGSHSEPTQPSTTTYAYIIGDPRSRTVDNGLGGGTNVANGWDTGRALYDLNGNKATDNYQRSLEYYYPTQSDGDAFRIVAPRFRIVSFNNASGKSCTHHSAAMRCASLQEDGFPAGRWRLPTVAEIQYIIMLQEAQAIQPIFTSNGSYYATASYSDAGHNRRIAVAYRGGKLSWNSLNANISVRCVYDEWYWGSNREAVINTGRAENVTDNHGRVNHTNKYLFTWGDKPINWQ